MSIPYMKGNLYSKEDNKPIVGADIYINHYLFANENVRNRKHTFLKKFIFSKL